MQLKNEGSSRDLSLLPYLAVATAAVLALLGGVARIADRPVAPIDAPVARSTGGAAANARSDERADARVGEKVREKADAKVGDRAPAQRAAREDSTAPFRPRG